MSKRIKSGWLLFRCIILICIGFAFWEYGCSAAEGLLAQKASQSSGSCWRRVSSRGQLELWIQPSSGLIRIRDRRINFKWEPDSSKGNIPAAYQTIANYWKAAYQSAFVVRYLNDSGNLETVFTGQPECQKQLFSCPSRTIFRFYFTDCQIGFQAVYTLGRDYQLQIVIPFKKIWDPKRRLLDIRVLPYFGPLTCHSRDYLVIPDGCGGIVKPDHYAQSYKAARIYGERFSWNTRFDNGQSTRVLQLTDYTKPENTFLSMPIFGVVKGKAAFLGMISQGQFQAEMGVEITPLTLRPAISTRLIFREITYDILGRLHSSPVFDGRDRIMNYYFLAGSDASYVGIARKYRKISITSMRPSPTTPVQTEYRLRLFMGVNEQYLDTSRLICLTKFKQAETILKDLHQQGVRHIQVILVGWSNRGYLGDNPQHFPPDRRLGGVHGLKRLISVAGQLGISIGLQFDNSYTFRNSHGFKRSDTVKDIQNVPIDIGFGQREYLLCPEVAWKNFLKKDFRMVQDYKLKGFLLFDGMNQGLFNCYDPDHPAGYQSTSTLIRDSFHTVAKTNPIAVTASSDFLYPNVAALYDLPAQSSSNCDESIPLIPIICHGWVPYSFNPINMRYDDRREFLKSLEYGAIPNAYLTMNSVDELIYAQYNPLVSGKYADWRTKVIHEYRIYEKNLQALQNRIIIDHKKIAKDVYLTAYDDGTKTIVNYGSSAYFYNGRKISALNYIIAR